jgi:large subunit ribosomal protein L17
MLRNMVTSLLQHERIRTTTPKAKVARRFADRMITLGKRGDLHARRMAARFINDETVLKKLFEEIAPKFTDRNGGYTRIMRAGVRKGDAADMAILELVTHSPERPKKVGNRKSRERLAEFKLGDDKKADKKAAKQEAAAAEEAPADAAEEAVAEEASEAAEDDKS